MPKKTPVQSKFRKQKFTYDQYWGVHYTEILKDKSELDYQSVIKARSAECAINILTKKTSEDNCGHKIKSVQVFMFSHESKLYNLKLNIEDWKHIRACSFPNFANHLFKHHKPRPKGYKNRFNKGVAPKNGIGFKKGNTIRANSVSEEEKPYMQFKGHWIPWPKEEREALKEKVQLHLSLNNNNRTYAAKSLGIHVRYLHKLMKQKFVEVDWDKDFPRQKPNISFAQSSQKRCVNIKKAWEAKSKQHIAILSPRVKCLKKIGLSNQHISTLIKSSVKTVANCLKYEQ
jgi:hypothetical protein